ncbi:hypothetical protein CNYM01_09586 [Colletotrichum nymphaeae SA-01]|uniref:Uncharacterized protein n=1 Tax=Colletotrichum nymphaeae SA-01 TaxID=1460502 RepID=A0A135SRA4_9PEZI|nr:hypothetical protein CNYM01_09586 [Colletotrichum nymphaeae SA-01]
MSLQKPTGLLSRSTWNCSAEMTANPDVSGIGVIVGFVGTGGLIILLLTVHYLFAYDPTLDPFRTLQQTHTKTSRPNAIDVAFLGWFREHMTHFGFKPTWLDDARRAKTLRDAFDKVRVSRS